MSIWVKNRIMAPAARNGPKGIIWVDFRAIMIKDIGRPMSEPKKIERMAIG